MNCDSDSVKTHKFQQYVFTKCLPQLFIYMHAVFRSNDTGSSLTNACTCMQVCGSKGLAAMLIIKRLTDVTTEVNRMNVLHVGYEACK